MSPGCWCSTSEWRRRAARGRADASRSGSRSTPKPAGGRGRARGSEAPAPVLDDARLRIPCSSAPPADARAMRVPASFVVHRQLFKVFATTQNAPSRLGRGISRRSRSPSTLPWALRAHRRRGRPERAARREALFRALRKPRTAGPAASSTATSPSRSRACSSRRRSLRTRCPSGSWPWALLGAWLGLARQLPHDGPRGVTLFQMQSILDGCDGEMSRVTVSRLASPASGSTPSATT